MNEPTAPNRIEPRWPVVLAIVVVLIMLEELPNRIRMLPYGMVYIIGAGMLVSNITVVLASAKTVWLKVERVATLVFLTLTLTGVLRNQAIIISEMVWHSREINGLQLLTSSVAMWVVNVLAFSMLYWQIDRGGPVARANNLRPRPDWLFPQDGIPVEELPPDWRPEFVDYLFLGFCTATAFSPTDVLPLTPCAKMLMMLESTISLVTIVAVASRAINILGS